MKLKSFAQFVRESSTTDDPITGARAALVSLIQSGAMDAVIRRDLLNASAVRSENTDPERDALKAQQDNLKRSALRNRQQQLRVKQQQVQSDIQKVATDIAKVGQKRVTR